MKETFYFSHDYNARSDEKIKKLIRNHGVEGYGIYWAIIEDLYNNENSLSSDYEGLAFDLRVKEDVVESIVNDFDLFVVEGEHFYSKSVGARLDQRNAKSAKARESAKARWDKKNANALQPKSECNAIKESKIKENKIKETKESSQNDDQVVSDYENKKRKLEEAFEKFWSKYPKKVNKKKAEQRFMNLTLKKTENLFVGLDLYIKKWRVEQTAKQYIPGPDVWLNNEKWTDEIVCEGSPHNRTPVQNKEAIAKKKIEDQKQSEESAKNLSDKKKISDYWKSLSEEDQGKMRAEAKKNALERHPNWTEEKLAGTYGKPLLQAELGRLIRQKI